MVPVAVIVAWQLLSASGTINPLFFPAPTADLGALAQSWHAGTLLPDVLYSTRRVLFGIVIGSLVGLVIGLAMGLSPRVDRGLNLSVQVLRSVPPITWVGFAILWFGLNDSAVVFLVSLGVVFTIAIGAYEGIRQIDQVYIRAAQNIGANRWLLFRWIILPGALGSILTALRIAVAAAWILVVVGELVGVPVGIGAELTTAQDYGNNPLVVGYMAVIGLMGFLFDRGVVLLGGRLLRWQRVVERK